MSMPHRDDHRRRDEGDGIYLTDEVFLYRVAGEADDVLELEDCYRLDVVQVQAQELEARGLRVVTPMPVE